MDKVGGPDFHKTELIKFKFLIDLYNPRSSFKYFRHFVIFKDGCPEEWIKWVTVFLEIEILMPLKEPADNTGMFRTLLKGQDLSQFEHHLKRRMLEA
jgi:hypothetical protein